MKKIPVLLMMVCLSLFMNGAADSQGAVPTSVGKIVIEGSGLQITYCEDVELLEGESTEDHQSILPNQIFLPIVISESGSTQSQSENRCQTVFVPFDSSNGVGTASTSTSTSTTFQVLAPQRFTPQD